MSKSRNSKERTRATDDEKTIAAIYRAAVEQLDAENDLSELFGAIASQPVAFGLIDTKFAQHCPAIETTAGAAFLLLLIPVPEPKGDTLPLFVPAVISSPFELQRRRSQYSVATYFFGLDFDKGDAPLDVLVQRVTELNWCAVAYRSPSDGKSTSEILRCKGLITDANAKELCAPTPEAVLAKMVADGYRADILGTITIVDPCKIERNSFKGKDGTWREVVRTKIVVQHNPLAKSRLVGLLTEPFKRLQGESSHNFNARWARVIDALTTAVGLAADPACSDINRAFYLPSSLLPTDDVCRYVCGAPLDVTTLTPSKVTLPKQRVVRPTGGKRTGRYHLADLFNDKLPGLVRSDKGDKIECECPFDELHSNCGDPNDKGFFVSNSGACSCRHSHGGDHDPADYVTKMLADGWITEAELEAYVIRSVSLLSLHKKYMEIIG